MPDESVQNVGNEPETAGDPVSSETPADTSQVSASGAADAQVGTVMLDDTQYAYLHDSLALSNSLSVLGLFVCAALLGASLCRFFLEGWR